MNVQLCYNASENNVINKVISVIDTVECVLKNAMSVTNPVLILEYKAEMTNINYMFIPETGRYYFITDIIPLTGGRYEIHSKVDVLESFRTSILNLQCIIDKQESKSRSNLYLNDGSYVVQNNESISVINFENGFNEEGTYILICAGG